MYIVAWIGKGRGVKKRGLKTRLFVGHSQLSFNVAGNKCPYKKRGLWRRDKKLSVSMSSQAIARPRNAVRAYPNRAHLAPLANCNPQAPERSYPRSFTSQSQSHRSNSSASSSCQSTPAGAVPPPPHSPTHPLPESRIESNCSRRRL